MSTFIGKQNNKIVSVVLAKSLMHAIEFWNKNNIHTDEFDVFNVDDLKHRNVVPLVTTERKMIMNASCTEEQEHFVIV